MTSSSSKRKRQEFEKDQVENNILKKTKLNKSKSKEFLIDTPQTHEIQNEDFKTLGKQDLSHSCHFLS